MKHTLTLLVFSLFGTFAHVHAHEQGPSVIEPRAFSYGDFYELQVQVRNRRTDGVRFFGIEVLDGIGGNIPFATIERTFILEPSENRRTINVYVRKEDIGSVKRVCTVSKMRKHVDSGRFFRTRICSKVAKQ